jgi:hypothetical protein
MAKELTGSLSGNPPEVLKAAGKISRGALRKPPHASWGLGGLVMKVKAAETRSRIPATR